MQTTGQWFGGGAVFAAWTKLPAFLRLMIVIALFVVTVCETTILINTASFTGAIKAGEAAQGHAQIVDPNASLDLYHDRRPVSSADAMTGASVAEKAGNATKVTSEGQAMAESVDDIRAKVASGISISTTERLQLIKVETALAGLRAKEAEARKTPADATVREAEATAAGLRAKADKDVSAYIQCVLERRGDRVTFDNVINDPCVRVRPF